MRPSLLHDEKIYEQVVDDLALGVPQAVIAKSLKCNESMVSRWVRKKEIARDVAVKTLENVRDPIQKVRKSMPLAYLERHPATREAWAPPKIIENQLTIQTIQVELPKRLQHEVIDVDVPRLPGVEVK